MARSQATCELAPFLGPLLTNENRNYKKTKLLSQDSRNFGNTNQKGAHASKDSGQGAHNDKARPNKEEKHQNDRRGHKIGSTEPEEGKEEQEACQNQRNNQQQASK